MLQSQAMYVYRRGCDDTLQEAICEVVVTSSFVDPSGPSCALAMDKPANQCFLGSQTINQSLDADPQDFRTDYMKSIGCCPDAFK